MVGIPLAAMERVIQDVGISRISLGAKKALSEILTEEIKEITRKAHQFAKHSKKATILKEHAKLACKN